MISNGDSKEQGSSKKQDNIAYIRQMLGELRLVAKGESADMLCYLIEMAYMEAGDIQAGRRPAELSKVKRDKPPRMSA